jgi:hypothetical protein
VGREGRARTGAAALTLLLGTGLAYSLVAGLYSGGNSWIVGAFLVVSLMHFWYDGFIWSARRNQILRGPSLNRTSLSPGPTTH